MTTGIEDIEYFRGVMQEALAPPAEGYQVVQGDGGYPYGMRYLPYIGNIKPEFREATEEELILVGAAQRLIGEVRREVIPTSPGIQFRPIVGSYVHAKPEFHGLWSRAELDYTKEDYLNAFGEEGLVSKIPGARADWAPSQVVTYEPDLGEDLELSTEEERAWRAIEINPRPVLMNAHIPATGWSNLVVTCDCGARWPLNVGLKGDISRAERRRLLVDGGALQLPLHEPGCGA